MHTFIVVILLIMLFGSISYGIYDSIYSIYQSYKKRQLIRCCSPNGKDFFDLLGGDLVYINDRELVYLYQVKINQEFVFFGASNLYPSKGIIIE